MLIVMNENEIKLPIVVYDKRWHEVLVFLSMEDAEVYLDPGRARNNEYQIYDGKAGTLTINYITQKESFLFGLDKSEVERVVLKKTDDISHVDDLRETLINFIMRYDTSVEVLKRFSLDELIREAARLPKAWRRGW